MTIYRAYVLDPDGHFTRVRLIEAESDLVACTAVHALGEKASFEIWDGGRFVGRVDCKDRVDRDPFADEPKEDHSDR